MFEGNLRIDRETEPMQNNCPLREYFGNNVYDDEIMLHPTENCNGRKHRLAMFNKADEGVGGALLLTAEMMLSSKNEEDVSSFLNSLKPYLLIIFDELDEVMKWDDKDFYRLFMKTLRDILQGGGRLVCLLENPDNEIDEWNQDS